MSKGDNRQARRERQTLADQRNKRNRYMRSTLSLIGAILLSAVFYRLGVLHQVEPAFGQLEARLEERTDTSEVALVVINDDDYQRLFQSKSPLNPGTLEVLINAIAAGRPKLIGVDIDTSDPQFKTFEIPQSWPPIVWQRNVRDYPSSNIQTDRPKPAEVLGGRNSLLDLNSGLALLIDTEDNVTRRYKRLIETTTGLVPSFSWAIANKFDAERTKNLSPTTDELVIRYSGGGNRFRFAASQVLELSKGSGWLSQSPIQGRIVLLGGSFGATDRHDTPMGTMTGVEVLANAIETDLSGGGHRPPSALILILLLAFEGLWTVLIFHIFESKLIKPLLLTLPVVIIISLVCSFLIYHSLAQLPYFLFMLFTIVVYQGFEAFRHKTIIAAYERTRELGQHPAKRAK
jgi:CHASE2 domain-containing sensor protein